MTFPIKNGRWPAPTPKIRHIICPISLISLVALLYGDTETASGDTRQHQNASSETSSRYSHLIVRNYLQFVPVCRSLLQFVLFTPGLKKCRKSMGSNLGHGFSGHPGRFPGSRWVTANCEQQLMGTWTLYSKGGQGREASTNTLLAATMDPRSSTCTAQSEAPSSQCLLPQKRSSAFRFSHKLSFRD